ncbi:MAG: hypothetical protein AB7U82_28255 [Blastocatellales bacterium]
MRTPPKLSSPLTFWSEWVFPALWLLGVPMQIQAALRDPKFPKIVVIGWCIGCIFVLIYSWPIKLVTIEGVYFAISNYFITRRAPVAHLTKVSVSHFGRGPTIILYFEPPTPFGKRIRIIPIRSGSDFDETLAFLRSLTDTRECP